MSRWRVDVVLAMAATLLVVGAFQRWQGAFVLEARQSAMTIAATPTPPSVDGEAVREAAETAIGLDPFRLSHEPSDVQYVPRASATAMSAPTPPPFRGPLVLKGIVGGPPWQAIIDGLPGQPPGTVVSTGRTVDKLVVRSVGRDTVVIQAPDTIWRLTLRKSGQ